MTPRCLLIALLLAACASPARAEFIVSSAIVEFAPDGPHQQDIDLVSRSAENTYIVSEIAEVLNPGLPDQSRRIVTDPAQSRLLVTPDKTILVGGSRRVLRFVLLQEPDSTEHIYRVAVKPVIKGLDSAARVGLKILIGYEILVIIRPAAPHPAFSAERDGARLTIRNTGNTNLLLQHGRQCQDKDCVNLPVQRVYAGETLTVTLPRALPAGYSLWDGAVTVEQMFD